MDGIRRYRGQKLDDRSRRSVSFIDQALDDVQRQALAADIRSDRCRWVRDFYHEGRFWVAMIPLDGIRDVFGQAFNFSRPKLRRNQHGYEIVYGANGMPKRTLRLMNHVQCRFVMDSQLPVRLYAQASSRPERIVDGPADELVTDFVYSVEALGPKGVKFNLRDGYFGNLVCAHRFMSTQEMVFERIVLEGQYVTQSPALDLTVTEKSELLRLSLERSHTAGATEPYYLFRFCGTNNCTSNPFQILDEVVQYTPLEWIGAFVYRLPLNPRFYLWVRGLDADPTHRKLVREEFDDFIHSKDTKQRKRAYLRERKRERKQQAAQSKSDGAKSDASSSVAPPSS